MLYSSPVDFDPLDFRSEVETLSEAFVDSRADVRLQVGVATASSLSRLLTLAKSRQGLILHLSAHTVNRDGQLGLVLENHCGAAHVVWRDQLEDMLSVREQGLQSVKLLFLGTCNSEELAQIFVECGCRHVVALRQKVSDAVVRRFAQQFYLSLAVGEPLLTAFEGARRALRVDPNPRVAEQAEYFVLFGQRNADGEEGKLVRLCGSDPGGRFEAPVKDLEDAALALRTRPPPRVEHFVGRGQAIAEVLNRFAVAGASALRAIAVHGDAGSGKTALAVELARFASAPGRLFSCGVQHCRLPTADVADVVEIVEEHLEMMAVQLGVPMRTHSGCSTRSAASRQMSTTSSCCSGFDSPAALQPDNIMSMLLPARMRIRRGLQQLERHRGNSRTLLIIDDEVGAVSGSPDVRRFFGEILEHTHQVQILICSRQRIFDSLGSNKVLNMPLQPLGTEAAAKLFLHRVHRPLEPADLERVCIPGGVPQQIRPSRPTSGSSMRSLNSEAAERMRRHALDRLVGHPRVPGRPPHPLMERLAGHPGRILVVTSSVVPDGPTLFELATADLTQAPADAQGAMEAAELTPSIPPLPCLSLGHPVPSVGAMPFGAPGGPPSQQ